MTSAFSWQNSISLCPASFCIPRQAAATGTINAAERSYPTSEVRGRCWKDHMPEVQWPRRVTPGPRSGAAAESARLQSCRNGREELPLIQGQRRRPGGATPLPTPGAEAGRSNPTPEARGSGQEKQPHIQGAVAAWLQERLEELSHVQGQEGQQ